MRFWIALGASRILSTNHHMWRVLLSRYLRRRRQQSLDDVIDRLGCRHDAGGLLLIERMFVLRKCSRSGCFKEFQEIENIESVYYCTVQNIESKGKGITGVPEESPCRYHPGALRRNKLSCCGASTFRVMGCRTAL